MALRTKISWKPNHTRRKTSVNNLLALKELESAASLSNSANRTFFVSFMAIMVYLLVVVTGTTDYQLLIPNANVNLPFVNTDVSLFVFYLSAPVVVLASHFNLLQNLESHHHKLVSWRNAHPGQQVSRAMIAPFLYDYALLEKEGRLTGLVGFFAGFLFVYFAPFVLMVILWRFSDYQSWPITAWHSLLFLLDVTVIFLFNRGIASKRIGGFGVVLIVIMTLTAMQFTFVYMVTSDGGEKLYKSTGTIFELYKKLDLRKGLIFIRDKT